jgi:putative transcriptional regulator
MTETTAGRLLVATPLLSDPNFDRTVIFVCFHDGDGAFGVVLNRPVEAQAADLVPGWDELISPPGHLHAGGPVERSSFLGVGYLPDAEGDSAWWTAFGREAARGLGLVNLAEEPDEARGLERLRIFHGYAGWSADQLDVEIGENAWWVVDALVDDVFTSSPERLWNTVLLRQRGELAMYGRYPEDPIVN